MYVCITHLIFLLIYNPSLVDTHAHSNPIHTHPHSSTQTLTRSIPNLHSRIAPQGIIALSGGPSILTLQHPPTLSKPISARARASTLNAQRSAPHQVISYHIVAYRIISYHTRPCRAKDRTKHQAKTEPSTMQRSNQAKTVPHKDRPKLK